MHIFASNHEHSAGRVGPAYAMHDADYSAGHVGPAYTLHGDSA